MSKKCVLKEKREYKKSRRKNEFEGNKQMIFIGLNLFTNENFSN
jgi:hypothetical protein